ALVVAATVALAALTIGRLAGTDRGAWLDSICDVFGFGFAFVLATATLLHIARNPWAILLELLCLAGLWLLTSIRHGRQRSVDASAAACMIGLALVAQANVLRVLGPPGDLGINDILHLKWPAVVSLLWAIAGSALTLWSRKVASRSLWVA